MAVTERWRALGNGQGEYTERLAWRPASGAFRKSEQSGGSQRDSLLSGTGAWL